jgi:hypothetical protein
MERFLLPQLGESRFVHDLPLVELCNGLVAEALAGGFERLEVLAPQTGSAIAEIRAYKQDVGSPFFAVPSSMHRRVVRRFKAMAKMRRARPADTQGVIHFERVRSKPIAIPVLLRPGADGQADVVMTLPIRES